MAAGPAMREHVPLCSRPIGPDTGEALCPLGFCQWSYASTRITKVSPSTPS